MATKPGMPKKPQKVLPAGMKATKIIRTRSGPNVPERRPDTPKAKSLNPDSGFPAPTKKLSSRSSWGGAYSKGGKVR